ncbi:MAG: hypothetical protein RLZZ451_667 [Pseudomonadota bacterium]
MLNRDIYNKPPKENRLVNNGVAEVSEDHSEAAQAILRYELETFVCDGQYRRESFGGRECRRKLSEPGQTRGRDPAKAAADDLQNALQRLQSVAAVKRTFAQC